MNPRRSAGVVGLVLLALAGAELIPVVWCLAPLDTDSLATFAISAGATFAVGLALRRVGSVSPAPSKDGDEAVERELYRRDGVLIVVGAWLLASLFGALPYLVSGAIPNAVDALFESASGFTTTGASILRDLEAVPAPILFWRSMTQWLGGIGIVVLFVALLSELGPGARFLFKLEVPGPKAEILHSRVRQTAVTLFRIYLLLTAAQTLSMVVLGASVYDALTHTFSTVSTGGFSPHGASAGYFPPQLQLVILVFMLASGVNFALYYALLRRRDAAVLRDLEFRVYVGVGVAASLAIALDRAVGSHDAAGRALLDASFQVVSLLTTTGFATADFASWSALDQGILVSLMFAGGCAGSTSGGVKIIRLLVGWKVAMREVRLTFSPNSVIPVAIGEQIVPEESARSVIALLFLWGLGWGTGAVLLAVGDADLVTAATASLATVSNIGPGLAGVGPTETFAAFAGWQKLVMVVLMWLGRLEFFAVLALLQPRFWRR